MELHRAVRKDDLDTAARLLLQREGKACLARHDDRGFTPLMLAARHGCGTAMLALLLGHGADVHQESRPPHPQLAAQVGTDTALSLALGDGDPDKVALLLDHGANLHYRRPHGYNALLDAVHGRDIALDTRLPALLRLLIAHGIELDATSSYSESALRVLSHHGRFDGVQLLLEAGADTAQLRFSPLHDAVALGTLADVEARLTEGADLEARDWWGRTPWLLALHVGDVAKAARLLEAGSDRSACGRCGDPPLFFAVASRSAAMLDWLLAQGVDLEQRNDFGATALIHAAELDNAAACARLLRAGAATEPEYCGNTALGAARSRDVALLLLTAGADPARLGNEGRRVLIGLPPDPDSDLLDASAEDFRRARTRRFGRRNPEAMDEPFWQAMIRAGITGYGATQHYGEQALRHSSPVWCAQRFGQSLTLLPDGRIVLVGGEHEDHYDPDFCIYNDVFVCTLDGAVQIFGYPEAVFPPTDGHSATLAGEHLWIIGCIGYQGTRRIGHTPVYRLDTHTWKIEKMETRGDMPGWIYGHRATLLDEHTIGLDGGTVVLAQDGHENHGSNPHSHLLDLRTLTWQRAG